MKTLFRNPLSFELDTANQIHLWSCHVGAPRAPATMQKRREHTSLSQHVLQNLVFVIDILKLIPHWQWAKQEGQRRGSVSPPGTLQDQRCRARALHAMEGYPAGDVPKAAESAAATKDGNCEGVLILFDTWGVCPNCIM